MEPDRSLPNFDHSRITTFHVGLELAGRGRALPSSCRGTWGVETAVVVISDRLGPDSSPEGSRRPLAPVDAWILSG